MKDRNEEKQGYKKTKIGWIPEEWDFTFLGSVAHVQTGLAKNKKNDLENPIKLPYLRVANVQDGFLDLREIKSVEVESTTYKRYLLKDGDVLFTEGGDFDKLGRGTIWRNEIKLCLHQNHIFAVRCKEKYLNRYFLAMFAASQLGRRYFLLSSKQSTNLASINSTQLKAFPLPLPKISEQNRIAEILSNWDTAISLTRKLISQKKNQKKALIQQLLIGKERLSGFITKNCRKTYRFFELPVDWGCPTLREIAKERSQRNKGNGKATVLSCSKHKGFVESSQYFGKQVFSEDTSNYKIIRRGWFGYPSNHIEEGSIGLLSEHDVGIVSPIYTVFECSEKVVPEYLYAVFKTETFRHIFSISTNSSVDRRGSLRWREFSLIRVPLPEKDEQQAIANVLAGADREIADMERKLNLIEKQKRGLMQKLLTGEVRVNS